MCQSFFVHQSSPVCQSRCHGYLGMEVQGAPRPSVPPLWGWGLLSRTSRAVFDEEKAGVCACGCECMWVCNMCVRVFYLYVPSESRALFPLPSSSLLNRDLRISGRDPRFHSHEPSGFAAISLHWLWPVCYLPSSTRAGALLGTPILGAARRLGTPETERAALPAHTHSSPQPVSKHCAQQSLLWGLSPSSSSCGAHRPQPLWRR